MAASVSVSISAAAPVHVGDLCTSWTCIFVYSLVYLLMTGNTVSHLGHTVFSPGSFGSPDVGGYLYIHQSYQCLQQLTLPEPPFLFAVLLQKWEMPWARAFPLRLMLRLGAEFRCTLIYLCQFYLCTVCVCVCSNMWFNIFIGGPSWAWLSQWTYIQGMDFYLGESQVWLSPSYVESKSCFYSLEKSHFTRASRLIGEDLMSRDIFIFFESINL